mmetsp:Transcript_13650/g.36718  ORF Transcript_13650/g.36718 Transcript_13650/m.36718 type:complete len:506 (-) Transcript_13650:222-1739(-)
MSHWLCKTYKEPGYDDGDTTWDEASLMVQQKGEVREDPLFPQRALCPECSRPLRRLAKVPRVAPYAYLACSRMRGCCRCDMEILPGEMHFGCGACGVRVCKSCGPGVYIEREFDIVDPATGETQIHSMPAEVLHRRRPRKSTWKKSRSIVLNPVQTFAWEVVGRVSDLTEEMAAAEDADDAKWDSKLLLQIILGADDAQQLVHRMHVLVDGARYIMAAQPTLTEATVPCKVFGDIHGHLRDLLLMFSAYGMPGRAGGAPSFVFNGDFVDRGSHQLEVVAVLFALKILYPDRVWLNRGNHEDDHINSKYGFLKVCCDRLGRSEGTRLFKSINATFNYLPLACLVGRRILVLHGGIGDGKWDVDKLRWVKRPLDSTDLHSAGHKWIWNILWSDPIEDDCAGATFGVHSSSRSRSAVRFGWNVTSAFCARNGLDLIVRSHQSKRHGYGFDVMHNDSLVRVFTARDYEGNGNDGAVLAIAYEDEREGPEGLLTVRSQLLQALSKSELYE